MTHHAPDITLLLTGLRALPRALHGTDGDGAPPAVPAHDHDVHAAEGGW